jgi:hypothetical protein
VLRQAQLADGPVVGQAHVRHHGIPLAGHRLAT